MPDLYPLNSLGALEQTTHFCHPLLNLANICCQALGVAGLLPAKPHMSLLENGTDFVDGFGRWAHQYIGRGVKLGQSFRESGRAQIFSPLFPGCLRHFLFGHPCV